MASFGLTCHALHCKSLTLSSRDAGERFRIATIGLSGFAEIDPTEAALKPRLGSVDRRLLHPAGRPDFA